MNLKIAVPAVLAGLFVAGHAKQTKEAYETVQQRSVRTITVQQDTRDISALMGDYKAAPCSIAGKAYLERVKTLNADKMILYSCTGPFDFEVLQGVRRIPAGSYSVPDMRE